MYKKSGPLMFSSILSPNFAINAFCNMRDTGLVCVRDLFFRTFSLSGFRRGSTVILAFSWVFGLLTGGFLSCVGSDSVSELMGGCVYASVSIVTLLQVYMIPFLFSALAVFLSFPWLLPAICFGKAMLFSFVFSGLIFAWGTSASFLCSVIMACDLLSMPFLYFWWLRNVSGTRRVHIRELIAFALPALAIVTAVRIWVIPFAADVLIL